MIQLQRPPKPIELTRAVEIALTQEFKDTKKTVWKKPYIQKALMEMSNSKCAFCEMKLGEESKYMEVEHFHDKSTYPDEVVQWDNLLPSCKTCNGTKSTHDTKVSPIVEPSKVDPKLHLGFKLYRLRPLTELGKNTISVLNLNDTEKRVWARVQIGEAIQNRLEDINSFVRDYVSNVNATTRRKNLIIRRLKALLKKGTKTASYSAITATIILNEMDFKAIKNQLQNCTPQLWDEELNELEKKLQIVSLQLV